jgi:AcrR family transcriptional regulator
MIRRVSESRDRVARQALEMFAAQSYDAVSMRDLGQALNIQAPSIYSHFPSKESLLLSTLAPLLDSLDEVFAEVPAASASADQRRGWLRRWVTVLITHRLASRVAMYDRAVMGNHALQPRMWNMHLRLMQALAAFGVTDHALANAVIGGVALPIHAADLDTSLPPLTVDRAVDLAERWIAAARTP